MNKVFRVEVIETLSKTITVNAKDELSALKKVKTDYKNEAIILDNESYVTTEFLLDTVESTAK